MERYATIMVFLSRQGKLLALGVLLLAAVFTIAGLRVSVGSRAAETFEREVTISISGYSIVGSSVRVDFQLSGDFLKLGAEHVHVYVDGQLVSWRVSITVSGYGSYLVNNLSAGQHLIEIVLAMANHAELSAIRDSMTVTI